MKPSRLHALSILNDFAPSAGVAYTRRRNFDIHGHPHVSCLSPYIRHRIVTEEEVLHAVLSCHSATSAEKFIQEVFWRTYWKGWLQLRPSIWSAYLEGLHAARNQLATQSGLRVMWEDACAGTTKIEAFDHWAQELVQKGYLHNHARMWFASIWIFTLKLPWELGADFFLRHLLDGDPASNTLSWRWVAGLQTQGKTYLARSDNIAQYTEGKFTQTQGLAQHAPALPFAAPPAPGQLPVESDQPYAARWGLLVTEEDLTPRWLIPEGERPTSLATLNSSAQRSPLIVSPQVQEFTAEALKATVKDLMPAECIAQNPEQVAGWARELNLDEVITSFAPVGPTAKALNRLEESLREHGIGLRQVMRPYDRLCWPYAIKGFFRFKTHIPQFLAQLGLQARVETSPKQLSLFP